MRLAVALAAAALALAAAGVAVSAPARTLAPYRGAGSWVSVYDGGAWAHPDGVVRTLAAHHVHTLFVQTANDDLRRDVFRPAALGRLIDDAHAAGLSVVGWYLPSLATPARDVRRALAGARFRSASGEGFDSFALDIEATNVRSLALRDRRAVAFAAAVRRSLPAQTAIGAITPDPTGALYWRDFPFAQLAPWVDVFLPMEYFTFRTSGAAGVSRYTAANIVAIRGAVGDARFPVHAIGGDALGATASELHAFFGAAARSDTVGVSLWEYGETSPAQWAALGAAA
ncbi:MAG TPA: hypothetical protein VFA05_00670 [Gaiellaceae bacterium]|nr:hypothetical protein [Gaiellaceae bacterium]